MLRRDFLKISIFTAAVLTTVKIEAKTIKLNNSKNKKTTVAILGAGFAGLSTAKYLKDLNPLLDVTVIEKRNSFMSCPLSNAWLGGLEGFTYESLNFDYNSAISKYKFKFLNETVSDINIDKKQVITNESIVEYDYMIMALGIDYNYKKLFRRDNQKAKRAQIEAPAGLKPGSEHLKLKKMISNFKGGNFIITLPSSSYKCPPAPYERACMIAHYFKENKIDGKVIILDPRVKPASKAKQFTQAYNTIYKDYVEYRNLSKFKDVDFDKKTAYYKKFDEKQNKDIIEELKYEEISIIPPNKANKLYKKAGIKTYTQGWVKLKQPTFRTVTHDDIYVIGDAQGEYPYPKSGQMANSCAFIVASDLIDRINNKVFDYTTNLPGNVCYSLVAKNLGISVTHTYTYDKKIIASAQSSDISKDSFDAAKIWYKGITNDMFGL